MLCIQNLLYIQNFISSFYINFKPLTREHEFSLAESSLFLPNQNAFFMIITSFAILATDELFYTHFYHVE